jgi:hypothetical protein
MNQQKRAVQFADQHDSRTNGQEELVMHICFSIMGKMCCSIISNL